MTNSAVLPQCLNSSIEIGIEYIDYTAPTDALDTLIDQQIEKWISRNQDALEELDSGYYLGVQIDDAQARAIRKRLDSNIERLRYKGDLNISNFPVEVWPSTLEPTSYEQIEPGRYVFNANISQYAYGLVRVTATVVNITPSIV